MVYLRLAYVNDLENADVSAIIKTLPFGEAEKSRLASFSSKHRQLESLAALMLMQDILRERGDLSRNCVISRDTDDGKPRFADPDMPSFSISHSCGYAGVALGDGELGLDVELVQGRPHKAALAKRFFTRREREAFERGGGTDEVFMKLWTQKEALVKLHGTSLAESIFNDDLSGELIFSDDVLINGANVTVSLYSEKQDGVDMRVIKLLGD